MWTTYLRLHDLDGSYHEFPWNIVVTILVFMLFFLQAWKMKCHGRIPMVFSYALAICYNKTDQWMEFLYSLSLSLSLSHTHTHTHTHTGSPFPFLNQLGESWEGGSYTGVPGDVVTAGSAGVPSAKWLHRGEIFITFTKYKHILNSPLSYFGRIAP